MHIRIIPMSMEDSTFVGKSIKEVQDDYFNDYLINVEKGWYFYAKSGLNANEGDLLLFQMSNSIIASATLYDVMRFTKITEDGCKGALILKDVKTFKPITSDELTKLIPEFSGFTQAKLDFDSSSVNLEGLKSRIEIDN